MTEQRYQAVYRSLVRAGVIEPDKRHPRKETWKRWERGAPMELWQMDMVSGFLLADGTAAKALTGIDGREKPIRPGWVGSSAEKRPRVQG